MPLNEVFPNPTVKQVIFQIRFPNLFYIENRIGDLQMKLMKEFPESSLKFQQKFLPSGSGLNVHKEDVEEKDDSIIKIWSFESKKKCMLNVHSDSLDISSSFHKTYNNEASKDKFRDVISFVLKSFFDIMQIPLVKRIGLRYIDECPIPKKETKTFKEYYKTTFPVSRFKLEDASEMAFRTVVKRGSNNLIFSEQLNKKDSKFNLILDFDAFRENIKSESCLKITDQLHELILKEYEKSLKEPVFKYMRKRPRKKK